MADAPFPIAGELGDSGVNGGNSKARRSGHAKGIMSHGLYENLNRPD